MGVTGRVRWTIFRQCLVFALFLSSAARGQMGGSEGRFDFAKGRLLSWAGDAAAAPQTGGGAALQDLTVAAALDWRPGAADEVALAAWPDAEGSIGRLCLKADGSVAFRLRVEAKEHEIRTRPGALPSAPGLLTVAVSIRRNPRQALAGLWINGVEHASASIPPGEVEFDPRRLTRASGLPAGARWRRLEVYDRALERWELLDWALAQETAPAAAQEKAVAVLGGSEAVAVMEEGTFEALFAALAGGGAASRARSLAWEGDTVFGRDRPMNFGGLRQQLRRAEAGVALLMFGRQECLERGAAGINDFKRALTALVAECREVTPEVWLAGLPPFEKKAPPLPDLSPRNAELAAYDAAIREVAAARKAAFIDLRAAWPAEARDFTSDGVNLSSSGARLTGRLLLAAEEPAAFDSLRALARAKNRLWNHYWRPTNWAFLHGDRTAQPSSRDHVEPRLRWFPAETEVYLRLAREKEAELVKAAAAAGRKLP